MDISTGIIYGAEERELKAYKSLKTGRRNGLKQNWFLRRDDHIDVIKYFSELAVDYTDNRFYVRFETDDGGKHVVITSEEGPEGDDHEGDFSKVDQGVEGNENDSSPGYINTFMHKN